MLQLSGVNFGYSADQVLLKNIDIDVGLDSRIAVVGPNGAGKSTLWGSNILFRVQDADVFVRIKLLTGELGPLNGELKKNGRLRM